MHLKKEKEKVFNALKPTDRTLLISHKHLWYFQMEDHRNIDNYIIGLHGQ